MKLFSLPKPEWLTRLLERRRARKEAERKRRACVEETRRQMLLRIQRAQELVDDELSRGERTRMEALKKSLEGQLDAYRRDIDGADGSGFPELAMDTFLAVEAFELLISLLGEGIRRKRFAERTAT